MIYIDPWTMTATMHRITINKKDIRRYAQYDNSLYIEYIEYVEKGKRKAQYQYFHYGDSVLLYNGFLPAVPSEMTQKRISANMYEIRNAGMCVHDFMVDVFRYYKENGHEPIVNTLQF